MKADKRWVLTTFVSLKSKPQTTCDNDIMFWCTESTTLLVSVFV